MKELSLNILDITENSVKAGAALTEILLDETEAELSVTIRDNGCGMTEEVLKGVTDPFYTTRTTRNVGLGLPLLKMAAEQTGGYMTVESKHKDKFPENCGTTVKAVFNKNHIDYTPLGDIISTLVTIIQGHPDTDFYFLHKKNEKCVELDTRQLRDILEDVPLNSYEVLSWVGGYLREEYDQLC